MTEMTQTKEQFYTGSMPSQRSPQQCECAICLAIYNTQNRLHGHIPLNQGDSLLAAGDRSAIFTLHTFNGHSFLDNLLGYIKVILHAA